MEIAAATQLAAHILRIVDAQVTLVSPQQVRREDEERKTKRASDPSRTAESRGAEDDSAHFSATVGAEQTSASRDLDRSVDLLV